MSLDHMGGAMQARYKQQNIEGYLLRFSIISLDTLAHL